ncbi:unnamed protein product [Brassicogethes aeneus]|uniref:Protein brambleberry-like n=1 Tax=Brassicogethes aeneus TaxID=1431903 RepID=A0A9P0B8H9_BRAAE|nr:unnamed protein product [Brassicogethes aeneus]
MKCLILFILLTNLFIYEVHAGIGDYVSSLGEYFGYKQEQEENVEGFEQKIPYEVSTIDEKFLNEAAKLTGVALSELDSCQHRVILKLKTDCHKLNDEQVAKLAVHLLNCQSYIEGRQIFLCTDEMSIKDCTIRMDSDTWTSYHLMSNRARAVCYMIRQNQFRGLAENTVNRLMDAAQNQLKTLGTIAHNQEDLINIAETTYETLTQGHETLSKQQSDLQKAQFHGQLAIEDNINRLVDEKKLILETHNELIQMTKTVKEKLENTASQMDNQSNESKVNHKELLQDLLLIQSKTHEVFQRIDESANLLMEQNSQFRKQYESTIKNLAEVNSTVHNLVALVGGTRQALEEKLTWITSALGGTDSAIERLYLIVWHFAFMLMAMLSCAFLTARLSTRIAVVSLPPLNLALAFYGQEQHLDPLSLGLAITMLVIVQSVVIFGITYMSAPKQAIAYKEDIPTSTITTDKTAETIAYASYAATKTTSFYEQEDEHQDSFSSTTPPLSRSDFYSPVRSQMSRSRSGTPLYLSASKESCHAKTRSGTPCKLSAVLGRDFCHRHQKGDSVMG